MPITKQYLRYVPSGAPFAIVGSANGQATFVELNGLKDRFVATSACENVIVWDSKSGEQVKLLDGDKADSTVLAVHNDSKLLASGYSDGSIRLFDLNAQQLKVTFNGHRSAVTCVAFDANGMRLASGGKDTEIVVWDVVAESGMFRLKGHKNGVTNVQFMKSHDNILISSSRDTFVKFWDLNTRHCFKTLVGHRSEVWDFAYLDSSQTLVTSASDSELRIWRVDFDKSNVESNKEDKSDDDESSSEADEDQAGEDSSLAVIKVGSILRKSMARLQHITFDATEKFVVCHATDQLVEVFRFRDELEIKEATAKRIRKERKKLKRKNADKEESELDAEVNLEPILSDRIDCFEPFKASAKVKCCSVVAKNSTTCKVAVLLASNSIETWTKATPSSFEFLNALKLQGHRTDVRTLSFSSDNFFVLSASADSVKVWSRASRRPIATFATNAYALCSTFVPGDKSAVIGTKEGNLHIYDVGAAEELECIRASDEGEPIWALDLYPNKNGFATGSEDKLVKFWDFEFVSLSEQGSAKRLSVIHKRTLKMDEVVLSVKISPNSKFIAVALADSTVKVFFLDTLKFFLSLYGHKFPVLTMDISSDSTLIATGSTDKNIKIWGLDFGDCHRSIFAHDDSVTCVRFVHNTHYLFSCSKDKTVKMWDCDNYEKIITLSGHQAEVWALAVSPNGKHVVSASHDKTLRLWDRTQEPLVLEEEKEMEREQLFEKDAFAADETVLPGENNEESALPGKKTLETVKATELIIEAVDVHKEETAARRAYRQQLKVARKHATELPPEPAPNPIMARFQTTCPDRFVLETLRRVRSAELDEALLCLPFGYASDLLAILADLMHRGWEVELLLRCVTFLTR